MKSPSEITWLLSAVCLSVTLFVAMTTLWCMVVFYYKRQNPHSFINCCTCDGF
ncbi:hypothetical protein BDB00DRAFT_795216 [Zychaea mexicana]|uniref:uncharacterized protein n=1 Tax=Zychaea mexicana TaxID=64656 RepID=UPI0022FEB127|nr:uncharacterized protein BDB00DRAFT_795216 [Zychaea mexicana]KAI9499711.1 hypothetical protein BDB00DRAFT_795216 [Zychaea mexicana]